MSPSSRNQRCSGPTTPPSVTTPVRCKYVTFCDHVLLGCSCMILFGMQQRVSATPGETTGRVECVEVNATHVDQVKSPLKIIDIWLEVPNTLHSKATQVGGQTFNPYADFYKQNVCLPWLRHRHPSPSAAMHECRQTNTCSQVKTGQVQSIHARSGQVRSSPIRRRQARPDQVRSPLRTNGIPSLELVSQRQSPM